MTIRILLVDDHRIVREGIRSLLEDDPDLEVIAEAENGRQAVQLSRELSPDVVILDVAMPDLNGIEATRQIVADVPGTRVIALSMHRAKRFVAEMFKAGASGYLPKDCASSEMVLAIRDVVANRTYLSPRIAGDVLKDYASGAGSTEVSVLAPREREVLQMLAEGKTTKQIALLLHLSVKTVETYRERIMKKLGINSLAELTKYAIREGLTSL
ncbi:MAG: response regulator transcription factor [Planctomycetota bacterium]